MISKSDFIKLLQHNVSLTIGDRDAIEHGWNNANEAAVMAEAAMPGIGLLSIRQRLNAFFAVCRHLDKMIEDGYINLSESQLSLAILRICNRKFNKAITMFDIRGPRYDARACSEMPRSAREYLAGLKMFG